MTSRTASAGRAIDAAEGRWAVVRRWLGVAMEEVSRKEQIVSGVGGLLAIGAVLLVSHRVMDFEGAEMVVASMGATAVLLFAVPHGQLSQPWSVIGGQLISAVIGVSCARWIDPLELAAGCAVGVSILAMHLARCIHPPGGATALTAVVAGPGVASLGYSFVWRPVLLNTVSILVVAVAYNAWFPWRRYPVALGKRSVPAPAVPPAPPLTHEQVRAALREIDSFVDVTEVDLVRLHALLLRPPDASH